MIRWDDTEHAQEQLDEATRGSLAVAEKLADHVLNHPSDPFAVALAGSVQDLCRLVRRLRRALVVQVSG